MYKSFNVLKQSRFEVFYAINKRFLLSRFSHPFHLVDPSIWPLITSVAIMYMALGGVKIMQNLHGYFFNSVFKIGLIILITGLLLWLHDVMTEATFEGRHTSVVRVGLKYGFILFIISEIFFFIAFFWGFFHMSLAPAIELGVVWPPIGIKTLNAFGVPLVNTIILLLSGIWVTSAHAFFASSRYFEPKERRLLRSSYGEDFKVKGTYSISLHKWIVGDYFYVRLAYEPWLPRITPDTLRCKIEYLVEDWFYKGHVFYLMAMFLHYVVRNIFLVLVPKYWLAVRWFSIFVALYQSLRIIAPDQHTYLHNYQKFGEYGKLGLHCAYWYNDPKKFGYLYRNVHCNKRRYLTEDFYDEGSMIFRTPGKPKNLINMTDFELYLFSRLQPTVRVSWLRHILRRYILVAPRILLLNSTIDTFSSISNSFMPICFRGRQRIKGRERSANWWANAWLNYLRVFFDTPFKRPRAIRIYNYRISTKYKMDSYRFSPSSDDAAFRIRVAALLGLLFLILQYGEYTETNFDITDSVYGSLFFVATGFHGFHVFVGMLMLVIASSRASFRHFFSSSALGFEAAAWYWHFVDVVWLFLYIFVYHWGS